MDSAVRDCDDWPMRAARTWVWFGLVLIAASAIALPAGVDLVRAGFTRADQRSDNYDRVHYGVHLIAGRILSVCPCTRGHAPDEYARALQHAGTSRRQALVTTERPQHVADGPRDAATIGWHALRALGRDARGQTLLVMPALLAMAALVPLLIGSQMIRTHARRGGKPSVAPRGEHRS